MGHFFCEKDEKTLLYAGITLELFILYGKIEKIGQSAGNFFRILRDFTQSNFFYRKHTLINMQSNNNREEKKLMIKSKMF